MVFSDQYRRTMAPACVQLWSEEQLDWVRHEGMRRVSGEIVCRHCGQLYFDHPIDLPPFQFLHVSCEGTRMKL